jgi:hypothetical protein
MRDLGWCVFDDDRIIAQGSVRNEETHIAVPDRVLHVIAEVAAAVELTRVAARVGVERHAGRLSHLSPP